MFSQTTCLVNDYETTGTDAHRHIPLLGAWTVYDYTYIIDHTTVPIGEVVTNEIIKDKLIIAHNADFEARVNLKHGLTNGRYACTMVRDQVILSGVPDAGFDIISCLRRANIPIPIEMNKDIRKQFINRQLPTLFTEEEIRYNASDNLRLRQLYDHQEAIGFKKNMIFLMNQLRGPLVKILAKGELRGFRHDSETWIKIAEEETQQANAICREMEMMLKDRGIDILQFNKPLLKQIDSKKNKLQKLKDRCIKLEEQITRMKPGTKSLEKTIQVLDRAKDEIYAIEHTDYQIVLNWASPQQVMNVLRFLLKSNVPKAMDQKTRKIKEGTSKAARTNWFAENDGHPEVPFMKLFDNYKNLEHKAKSFGKQWVENYLNPVTGKVHTTFRQAGTRTLRFASGDKDEGFFNLQQIPGRSEADKLRRACFKPDPGRSMGTLDYTGCEIVCMISLSRDLDLKRISELPDQHSYMGTKCWRNVYAYRYQQTKDPKWKILAETYELKNEGEGKKVRTKFKESGVFPVIYGVGPPKVASIQGFSKEEGRIFIQTIEAEMPTVVSYVKSKAKEAISTGEVIHNTRTNSRRIFPKVHDQQYGYVLSDQERTSIENAARNAPVQGTNVDIICEAMVMIDRWTSLYKVDACFLGQVHDELIYDYPEGEHWIVGKLKDLMRRAAQKYLIPEISMDVDARYGDCWLKEQPKK